MKILFHIQHNNNMYAGRYIGLGYRDAFIDRGHQFEFVSNQENISRKISQYSPDLFITSSHSVCTDKIVFSELNQFRSIGLCVAVQIDRLEFNEDHGHSLGRRPEILDLIRSDRFADIYFNYFQPEAMVDFERVTGAKHHTVLLAANRLHHYPAISKASPSCDAVFIGANLPRKRTTFRRLLLPLVDKYLLRIYGSDWTARDQLLGFIQRVSQYFNLGIFDRLRSPVLTLDEEREAYASAKIGINIHEDQQRRDGEDFNERTLKILACGTFELCDSIKVIRRYFAPEELVMAKDEDWNKVFEYYIVNEIERRAVQARGTRKVLAEHTYHNRVEQFERLWDEWRVKRVNAVQNE
jgi:Glycosyl transferases group 1